MLDRADCGGTVLRPFFSGLLRNFDWAEPKDQTIARLIVLMEQLLTRHSILPHYQTSIVARRRPVPRAPLSAAERERIGYTDWPGLDEPAPSAPTAFPATQPGRTGWFRRLFGKA